MTCSKRTPTSLKCTSVSYMGQDGLETGLPHDFDDLLANQLFRPVAEHLRVSFAHENIAQIGTATCEQKRRISQNRLSVITQRHGGVHHRVFPLRQCSWESHGSSAVVTGGSAIGLSATDARILLWMFFAGDVLTIPRLLHPS